MQSLPLEQAFNYISDNILGLDHESPLTSLTFDVVEGKDEQGEVARTLVINLELGSVSTAVTKTISKIVKIDSHFDIELLDLTAEIRNLINDVGSELADLARGQLDPQDRLFSALLDGVIKDVASSELLKDLSGIAEQSILQLDLPELDAISKAFDDAFDAVGNTLFVDASKTFVNFYASTGIAALASAMRNDGAIDQAYIDAVTSIGNGFLLDELDAMVNGLLTDDEYHFNREGFIETLKGVAFDGLLLDDIRDEFFDDLLGLDGKNAFEIELESLLTDETRELFVNTVGEVVDFINGDFEHFDFDDVFSDFDITAIAAKLIGAKTAQELVDLVVDIDSLGEAYASKLGGTLATSILGNTFADLAIGAATSLFGKAASSALATTVFQGLGALFTGGIGLIAGSLLYEGLNWVTGGWFDKVIDKLFGSGSPQVWFNVDFNGGDLHAYQIYEKDSNGTQRSAMASIANSYAERASKIIDFVGVEIEHYDGLSVMPVSWRQKSYGDRVWLGDEHSPLFLSSDPEAVAREAVDYTLGHILFDQTTMRGKVFEIWKTDMIAEIGGTSPLATPEAIAELERYLDRADFALAYADDPTAFEAVLGANLSVAQVAFISDYSWALSKGLFDGVEVQSPTRAGPEALAQNRTLSVSEDGQLRVLLDAQGKDLTFALAVGGNPAHGTAIITPHGGLVYAPFRNFYGEDKVSFTVTDGNGHASTGLAVIEVASDQLSEIMGTDESEVLYGTADADQLFGLGGDDSLLGGVGNDTIYGGDGDDQLLGEAGADQIEGDAGDDYVQGDAGNDCLAGGDGNDQIAGGLGSDRILGDRGEDLIAGDAGNDTIFGGLDDDELFGNDGDDWIEGEQGNDQLGGNEGKDTIIGGAGDDVIVGYAGDDELFGGQGYDSLFGHDGDDVIRGDAGDDQIGGNGGNDTLFGGFGADFLNGGTQVDTAVVVGARNQYTVTQPTAGIFSVVGPDGFDTLGEIEFLRFDDQTIRLLPGAGTNVDFSPSKASDYRAAMANIRDFDGKALGGNDAWLRIGSADVNGDGDIDQILVNKAIGRFAEVGIAPDGMIYFDDHGWAGETRVVGIYVDPLVQSGAVAAGGPFDSQRRFQNDLSIENISRVLGAGDYDHDGLQEVYFALTDKTAYLHAYMHADGNIRYANYQSQSQVIDYLADHGFAASVWDGWFI